MWYEAFPWFYWSLSAVLLNTSGGFIDNFRWYYWSLPVVLFTLYCCSELRGDDVGAVLFTRVPSVRDERPHGRLLQTGHPTPHLPAQCKYLVILLLMLLLNVYDFSSSVEDPVFSRLQSLQPPKVGKATFYFNNFLLTSAWKRTDVYRNGSAHPCLTPPPLIHQWSYFSFSCSI